MILFCNGLVDIFLVLVNVWEFHCLVLPFKLYQVNKKFSSFYLKISQQSCLLCLCHIFRLNLLCQQNSFSGFKPHISKPRHLGERRDVCVLEFPENILKSTLLSQLSRLTGEMENSDWLRLEQALLHTWLYVQYELTPNPMKPQRKESLGYRSATKRFSLQFTSLVTQHLFIPNYTK